MQCLASIDMQIAPNVSMPMLGFGTSSLTGIKAALDTALGVGYRLIDTAQIYGNEAEIGGALAELFPKHGLKREDVFITTKIHPDHMKQDEIHKSVLESLAKLQVDFLDLCLIHYPKASWLENEDLENGIVRKEAWKELEKCRLEGLTRAIGVSNYEVKHLKEMKDYATIPPAVNQMEFNPHFTRSDALAYCRVENIHFQAYTSLARNNPELMGNEVVAEIAEAHGASPAQILIAFPLSQGISAIPKSANPDRITANFESRHIRLSEAEIAKLSALNRNQHYTICTPWKVA